jgi:hypothetical protein
MRYLALIAALAMPAHAGVILVATSPSGESIMLTDETGPCLDGARLAWWVSPDASKRVPGCYRAFPQGVAVSFLDGDRADVPMGTLKAPTGL